MKRYIKCAIRPLENEDYCEVLCELASNPNTPIETLWEISDIEDSHVHPIQSLIAKNPSTPPDLLRKLANVPKLDVRSWVIRNPNVPQDVVEYLLYSDSTLWDGYPVPAEILTGVAQNPNISPDILLHLRDGLDGFEDWQVSRHLVNNPNTPISVLADLASSSTEYEIREAARERLANMQ